MSRVPFAEISTPAAVTPYRGRARDCARGDDDTSDGRHEGDQPSPLPQSLSRIPDMVGEAIAASESAAVEPGACEHSDDEHALAAALTDILARKPKRTPLSAHPATVDEDGGSDLAPVSRPIPVPSFVSALGCQTTPAEAEPYDDIPTTRANTALWLAAAQRRHLKHTLSRAGSWVATVMIGSTIVAIAAALLFGLPQEIGAWLGTAARIP